ncbi:hypothetical protein [Burkholderia phage vB_BglM_WTB]
MKITMKKGFGAKFEDIPRGDAFRYLNRFYIRTGELAAIVIGADCGAQQVAFRAEAKVEKVFGIEFDMEDS